MTTHTEKLKGVVVLGPAWVACGSYEVFKRQMRCCRSLGFKTFFLAVSPTLTWNQQHAYWPYYNATTTDLEADARAYTARSRVFFRYPEFWTAWPQGAWRSVSYIMSLRTRVMPIPEELRRFIAEHDVDTVICHHYFNMPLALRIKALIPGAQLILESQDVQSHHYDGTKKHPIWRKPSPLPHLLRDEMEICSAADVLIHYNRIETEVFRRHLPNNQHVTIFPAFDAHYKTSSASSSEPPIDFLIVSSGNDPNYNSLKWFLSEVWSPELANRYSLQIAGNVDTLFKLRKEPLFDRYGQHFLGRVDDLDALYRRSRVALLPTIEGQGISIKTIEALSYGKPIVAMPLSFRGFDDAIQPAIVSRIVDTAEAFRDRMIQQAHKGPPALDAASIEQFEALFSVEAQTEIYRKLLLDRDRRRANPIAA
jgi:polysaccharide biosynthesis protein PslH